MCSGNWRKARTADFGRHRPVFGGLRSPRLAPAPSRYKLKKDFKRCTREKNDSRRKIGEKFLYGCISPESSYPTDSGIPQKRVSIVLRGVIDSSANVIGLS